MSTVIQSDIISSRHLGRARDFGLNVPVYLANTFSAAYSVRRILQSYLGPCMRVRNKTNNAYGDVAFDGFELSMSSIVTVTVAGTSGWSIGQTMTLTAFAGAASVGVNIWYDQSGNVRNLATWSGDVNQQPNIVTSGVLETDAGIPIIKFDGASNRLAVNATVSVAWVDVQPFSVVASVRVASTGNYKSIWDRKTQGASSSAGYFYANPHHTANDNRSIFAGTELADASTSPSDANRRRVYGARYSGASSSIFVDGVQTATGAGGTNIPEDLQIGITYWGQYNANKYHELLLLPNVTDDLSALSQKLMAYYGME